jgi:arylsulfatase A-like enzyme
MEAVRTEKYKLINYVGEDTWELYDLEADPTEINNIFNTPEIKAEQEELISELIRMRKYYGVKNN